MFILWKLQLAVLVSDKVPQIVMGDSGRFRQVITNLVGNSVKVSTLYEWKLFFVLRFLFENVNFFLPVYRTRTYICSSPFSRTF